MLREVASHDISEVWHLAQSRPTGLTAAEAAERLAAVGPNSLRTHRPSPWRLLGRQLASPILVLLFVTAGVSGLLGEATNSVIIGIVLIASIGLGFTNEFRAERAAASLHDQVRHTSVVVRDGQPVQLAVTAIVPGDVVRLSMGAIVPADMRIVESNDLSCDESILTGESLPVAKSPAPVPHDAAIGDLTSCLLMGTVVQSGTATAVVVETGQHTEFGQIALGLSTGQPQTEFQRGLGAFSALLLYVAIALTTVIFIANILLQRPIIDSLLFSLAIAVGITPQLLPAVVSASLAAGSRALAKRQVLVKRLVCIEDLGDIDLLVTDKTGTLTEGKISFIAALPATGADASTRANPADSGQDAAERVTLFGLLATEIDRTAHPVSTVGLNALDTALWEAPIASTIATDDYLTLAVLPFDHERRRTSVLVDARAATGESTRLVVTKGSPEDVMRICRDVPAGAAEILAARYAEGARVVAVAHASVPGLSTLDASAETGLTLDGFLTFLDRPKDDAKESLERLARLGISVKIATGDSAVVAEKVVADIGLPSGGSLTGSEIDALDDEALRAAALTTTIFARVSPEQKARVIGLLRASGRATAFMGDGVNDALALHQADIGISVDTAADVAKDAADVLLLDKDLGVLADGVVEGRRIFTNTIKYVLMGTSSNFGNMFSASVASIVLPFLPMLPGQILLNNLLYDAGQLAIPGDKVDPEQLVAPSHWDIAYIRRFMFLFGPISSLFDFATFALMMWVFHAAEGEFQAGWFIESIATQTLIIFAIRTRRIPFFRSRPSLGLTVASLGVVAVGIFLPFSPVADVLGFQPLPVPFFLALVGMIGLYLVLVEFTKHWFFHRPAQMATFAGSPRRRGYHHRVSRRVSRFSSRSHRAAPRA